MLEILDELLQGGEGGVSILFGLSISILDIIGLTGDEVNILVIRRPITELL